jgi:hypothetical protein
MELKTDGGLDPPPAKPFSSLSKNGNPGGYAGGSFSGIEFNTAGLPPGLKF